jgi:hypothetical protein
MQLPAIDQNICGAWTEQEQNLYNKLPFYLVQAQVLYRKHWTVWSKLLDSVPWKPNQGDTMRRVGTEPTPILRQEAHPERINTVAKVDVVAVRERKVDAFVHWQKFVSPHFNFVPDFQDFMKHIDDNMENLNKMTTVYEDVFYRTRLFNRAPYVYVAGVGLVAAPTGDGTSTGTSGKTWAWLQNAAFIPLLGAGDTAGFLTFEEVFKAMNLAETEVGMTPFEGSGLPGGDSSPLNQRFALVQSPESWSNFVNDPWLKENRPIQMNIVTEGFRGDLWGKLRSRQERFALRWRLDANAAVVDLPAPETIEEGADRDDLNRTKPNPLYTRVTNCPIEVAFLVGGKAGEYIDVGPPPNAFTRDTEQGAATKMNWNGKAYLTKDFLVPCKDQDGNTQMDSNSWGEYIRAQASLTMGMSPMNAFNILPVIYKRRIGVTTVSS